MTDAQIDLFTLSQLITTGIISLVGGLIAGSIITYMGYRLGRKQADDNWQRELKQREKEHRETLAMQQKQFEEQRRIAADKSKQKGFGPVHWDI